MQGVGPIESEVSFLNREQLRSHDKKFRVPRKMAADVSCFDSLMPDGEKWILIYQLNLSVATLSESSKELVDEILHRALRLSTKTYTASCVFSRSLKLLRVRTIKIVILH